MTCGPQLNHERYIYAKKIFTAGTRLGNWSLFTTFHQGLCLTVSLYISYPTN